MTNPKIATARQLGLLVLLCLALWTPIALAAAVLLGG